MREHLVFFYMEVGGRFHDLPGFTAASAAEQKHVGLNFCPSLWAMEGTYGGFHKWGYQQMDGL